MGMKVKAIERNVAFNKDAKEPKWAYVMQPEYYGQLDVDKVVEQAAQASGLAKGVLLASLSAYGSVVKTWATEGHTIPIPGLGSMRFGLRSTAVDDVTKVSASLITSRRVIFIPNTDIKQALANTGHHLLRPYRKGGEDRDFEGQERRGGQRGRQHPERRRHIRRQHRRPDTRRQH